MVSTIGVAVVETAAGVVVSGDIGGVSVELLAGGGGGDSDGFVSSDIKLKLTGCKSLLFLSGVNEADLVMGI